MSEISETEIKSMTKEQNYLRGYRDGKSDVLDKIRAEIIENSIEDYKYHGCGSDELIIDTSLVIEIIDKCKAESEK